MAEPLYDLLRPHLSSTAPTPPRPEVSKYLARLASLHLHDLTANEPQSLAQANQSNLVSLQALSSRSHRTTTTSADHLATLQHSLPRLHTSVDAIKAGLPDLDASAVAFAAAYNRPKDEATPGNELLHRRRESALLVRQADKAQDILELPSLLSAAIASAHSSNTATGPSAGTGANYTQALDLFAHIKRLQILYPQSRLVRSVLAEAEVVMKDMTTNLLANLRGPNIRLAAAIRMIGWLRRVAPELNATTSLSTRQPEAPATSTPAPSSLGLMTPTAAAAAPEEGHFGALFLCARLCTFLTMTEALAPLRDLADQETESRLRTQENKTESASDTPAPSHSHHPPPTRKASGSWGAGGYNPLAGQQTERYLKRYIEIFREQSFATVSMYRNIFPHEEEAVPASATEPASPLALSLTLPPSLQSFPLHLVEVFMSTLKQYLPNVTDPTARESLLMQVLYAANSLGRLGADFSLMIALLDDESDDELEATEDDTRAGEAIEPGQVPTDEAASPRHDPAWVAIVKKHRVQAARLEAMAAGQDKVAQRQEVGDIAVR